MAGCSVFTNEQTVPLEYIGEWKWDRSTGGFGGWIIDADSVDYSQSFKMNQSNEAFWLIDGEIEQKYLVENLKNEDNGEFLLIPVNTSEKVGSVEKVVLNVEGDVLKISDQCADCYIHTFSR